MNPYREIHNSTQADAAGKATAKHQAPSDQGLSVSLFVDAPDDPLASFVVYNGNHFGGAIIGETWFGPFNAFPGEEITIVGTGLAAGNKFTARARGTAWSRSEMPPSENLASGVFKSELDVAVFTSTKIDSGDGTNDVILATPPANLLVKLLGYKVSVTRNVYGPGGIINVQFRDADVPSTLLFLDPFYAPPAELTNAAGFDSSGWVPLSSGVKAGLGHRAAFRTDAALGTGRVRVLSSYVLAAS